MSIYTNPPEGTYRLDFFCRGRKNLALSVGQVVELTIRGSLRIVRVVRVAYGDPYPGEVWEDMGHGYASGSMGEGGRDAVVWAVPASAEEADAYRSRQAEAAAAERQRQSAAEALAQRVSSLRAATPYVIQGHVPFAPGDRVVEQVNDGSTWLTIMRSGCVHQTNGIVRYPDRASATEALQRAIEDAGRRCGSSVTVEHARRWLADHRGCSEEQWMRQIAGEDPFPGLP